LLVNKLFVPCKQQADATVKSEGGEPMMLFLPCKQQADTTLETV